MQLSKTEELAYTTIKKNNFAVFRIRELCLLLNINKTKAYNLIKALKKKNAIKTIKGGLFTFKDINELAIATALHYPSYISFWSALNYYGFSDQTPNKIFIATTKYSKEIGIFKYVTLSKRRFFGYQKIGDIVIAEKEKVFIDALLFPKYSGGIKEIYECLKNAINQLNKEKMINYALKVNSKSVIRRLGFLLEKLEHKQISILKKNIGKGYEKLDPTLQGKNNLNKQWLLDINW